MARGKSGRIVLEINPATKRNLYLALEKNQVTLKDWFVETANSYIASNINPHLFDNLCVAEENTTKYTAENKRSKL